MQRQMTLPCTLSGSMSYLQVVFSSPDCKLAGSGYVSDIVACRCPVRRRGLDHRFLRTTIVGFDFLPGASMRLPLCLQGAPLSL